MFWLIFACCRGYGGAFRAKELLYQEVLLNFFSLGPINDLLSWSGWTPIAKVINTHLTMQFKESFIAMMVMLMLMMIIIMGGLC